VNCVTVAGRAARENPPVTEKAPISKAALYATLCREFALLKAPDCENCRPLLPRRLGSSLEWTSQLAPCPKGCHREYEFLTRLFSQQYRLRDLCDTIG
jgi:hypothetical protein